jgi:hypothetical protein
LLIIKIDIFSKFLIVIPLKTKQPQDMLDGIKEGFRDMGGNPRWYTQTTRAR